MRGHASVESSGPDCYAGVDFGGTKIAAVLATSHGEIFAEGVIPTLAELGPAQAIERACALLRDLENRSSVEFRAIGLGVPGLVDRDLGQVLFLPNLPGHWRGVGMVAAFEECFKRPASLLNDARMATLGEFTFGGMRGQADLLFVTLGTGIGGGLILDGKLRLGAFSAAGEIGHHTVIPDGVECSCGSRGCLETVVSGPVLAAAGRALMRDGLAPQLEAIVGGDPARISASRMGLAARSGDTAVSDAIRRGAEFLGIGIANAVTIAGVSNVVVGGGLSVLGDLLLAPIRQTVGERVRMFPPEVVQIACSVLGEKSGVLGGVVLALQSSRAFCHSFASS